MHAVDLGPDHPVCRIVAGDRVAGTDKPQPTWRGWRNLPRHTGAVVHVVVLEADAVAAGHHHCRVCGTLCRARSDEDSRLGPVGQPWASLRQRGGDVPWVGRYLAGERGNSRGDGAVSREQLIDEEEAIGNGLTIRTGRHEGMAVTTGHRRRTVAGTDPLSRTVAHQIRKQHHEQNGDDAADSPAPHRAKLGPLGAHNVAEAILNRLRG